MIVNFPAQPGQPLLSEDHSVACQAFARCENAATGGYAHPILGAVLSCARCAERLDEALQPASIENS
jgi:hypothetical protein